MVGELQFDSIHRRIGNHSRGSSRPIKRVRSRCDLPVRRVPERRCHLRSVNRTSALRKFHRPLRQRNEDGECHRAQHDGPRRDDLGDGPTPRHVRDRPRRHEIATGSQPDGRRNHRHDFGCKFSHVIAVDLGSKPAVRFTINNSDSITAVSPAGTGVVNVVVETASVDSLSNTASQFVYDDSPS
jgi:hypothetical protein